MVTYEQLAAARRYAPPLIEMGRVDRRGARMRWVNRRAVEYAQRAGLTLEEVYPLDIGTVRTLAPPAGTIESMRFLHAGGLSVADVYPPPAIAGETGDSLWATKQWRWGWAAVGVLVGAMLAGPFGAVAGGIIGGTR